MRAVPAEVSLPSCSAIDQPSSAIDGASGPKRRGASFHLRFATISIATSIASITTPNACVYQTSTPRIAAITGRRRISTSVKSTSGTESA